MMMVLVMRANVLSAFCVLGTVLIQKTVSPLRAHKKSYKGSFIVVESFRRRIEAMLVYMFKFTPLGRGSVWSQLRQLAIKQAPPRG